MNRIIREVLRDWKFRPLSTWISIMTLGLAAGAGGAVFAVANATIMRKLPFPHSDRLVKIFSLPPQAKSFTDRNPLGSMDYVKFREWTRTMDAIEGIWARERALGGDGEPVAIEAAAVSPGTFQLLGATPQFGRTFTEEEDRLSAHVAVLSYGLWQSRYGSDPGIIGHRIQIDREPYEVIGVMRSGFEPAFITSELWLPLGIYEGNMPTPNSSFIQTIGRVRPGFTERQASDEVNGMMQRLAGEFSKSRLGWTAFAMDLRRAQFGEQRAAVIVLIAAALVLSVIASANMANLALAEVLRRRTDTALRTILGAKRTDLLAPRLVESVLIATAGTALGLVLSRLALSGLLALNPGEKVALKGVTFDGSVALWTAMLALLASVFAHVWPVLRISAGDVATELAESAVRTTGSRRGSRARSVLLTAQTTLLVVLLVAGALLLSAFTRLLAISPGYDARDVLLLRLRIAESAYPTVSSRAVFLQRILERIEGVPGVIGAGTFNSPLTAGNHYVTLIDVENKPTPDGQLYTVEFRRVSPHYFNALRLPLLSGRAFRDDDGTDSPKVAVVSRSFADRYFTGEKAEGQRVGRTTDSASWKTIVGVVEDARDYDLNVPPQPTLYVPFAQNNAAIAPASLAVRTQGSPLQYAAAIRRAITAVDPLQPVDRVMPMEEFLAETVGPQEFRSALILAFATLGLALASIGIYGVASRSAQEYVGEFGIRLALGAKRPAIWQLAMGRSLKPVALGIGIGLALATAASVALQSMLDGLSINVSAVFMPVLLLVATAVLAAAWPAYHASTVDPCEALRANH